MTDWTEHPRITIHPEPDPIRLGKGQRRLGRILAAAAAGARASPPILRAVVMQGVPGALLVVIAWMIVADVRRTSVEIAAIAVPEPYVRLGFTPEVMARRLRDQIVVIQGEARSAPLAVSLPAVDAVYRRTAFVVSVGPVAQLTGESPDFSIPGVGLSLTTLSQAARRLLGMPNRQVTGELTLEQGSPSLRLRISGGPPLPDVGAAGLDSMDPLLHAAARELLLQQSPDIVVAYAMSRDDSAGALALAERVEREALGPVDARARAVLWQGTILHQRLNRPAEAEAAFRRAIATQPSFQPSHLLLGLLFLQLGRLPEAEASLREAIRLDPRSASAHAVLGSALHGLGRSAEAEERLREAVRLDPADSAAHNELGLVLEVQNRAAEAEAAYREAARLDPRFVLPRSNLGNVLRQRGRAAEAEAAYREAARLDPRYVPAHLGLGNALWEQGRWAEAETPYREAARLDPAYAPAHHGLGNALWQQGRRPEAEAAYREAIRLDPRDAFVRFALASLLDETEQFALALEQAREAVRVAPDAPVEVLTPRRALMERLEHMAQPGPSGSSDASAGPASAAP